MPDPLLDDDDLVVLNDALQRLEDNEENLNRAEQAGMPTAEIRARFEEDKSKIRRIKTAFFPGR